MLYTLIAITAAAVVYTLADTQSPTGSHQTSGTRELGYDCTKEFADHMTTNFGEKFKQCFNDKWTTTDATIVLTHKCCGSYDMYRTVQPVYERNCAKHPVNQSWLKLMPKCQPLAQDFDAFCSAQTVKPMDTGCQEMSKRLDSITGFMPTGNGPKPLTASSRRPSTAVWVILSAIVVSIVVSVYGF